MASALIVSIKTTSGNQPRALRPKEEASQTFAAGTPVSFASDGGLQAWDGVTIGNIQGAISGISKVAGNNLATTGVAKQITQGSVQNESSAVNLQRPFFNDGKIDVEQANKDTEWYAQIGPSQLITNVVIGSNYGLTIDTDGHWYVDLTKTGASAVVTVYGLDYNDTVRGVHFYFLENAIN